MVLKGGQTCRIANTEGGQVVGTWAFCVDDADEYLLMEHSRSANDTPLFKPGQQLYSNRSRPLLRLLDGTSAGYDDTLHAACSAGSNHFHKKLW